MTDTTDIAALRAETWELHSMQDATEFADKLLDLLEAERQQREKAEKERDANIALFHSERSETEHYRKAWKSASNLVESMKNECGKYRKVMGEWVEVCEGDFFETNDAQPANIVIALQKSENAELRTKLANPVVLPPEGFVTFAGEKHGTYPAKETREAIHAAGFTVKE